MFSEGNYIQVQLQNRAAMRINFHDRDRSVGMLAENLPLQMVDSLEFQLMSITDTDFGFKTIGTHQRGRATTRLLRRVLRRVLETVFEKVLRRVLRRCLAVSFIGSKGSEKGS